MSSGLLFPEDVARIWTEERRKTDPDAPPVAVRTVWSYRSKANSTSTNPDTARYAGNPMPPALASRSKRHVAWYAEQEKDLRDWWNNRPGPGRKPAGNQ